MKVSFFCREKENKRKDVRRQLHLLTQLIEINKSIRVTRVHRKSPLSPPPGRIYWGKGSGKVSFFWGGEVE